jgi:peptidoglycan/LPS O-acetylase OafA/YrhL
MLVVMKHISAIDVGGFGVDIFFIVSGFVIALVGRDEKPLSFVLRRIFRIVPLYWIGTLAIFLIAARFPHILNSTRANVPELLKSLFFVPFVKESGIMQPILFLGWTLNYEVFFYAVFAISLLLSDKRSVLLCSILIGLCALAGTFYNFHFAPLEFWTRPVTLEFVAGMWLFVWLNSGRMPRLPPLLAIAGVFVLLLIMTMLSVWNVGELHLLLFGSCAFGIVALLLSLEGKNAVPMWVSMIGDASYSLYLLHPYIVIPPQKLAFYQHAPEGGKILIALVAIVAAILVALASYRFIEKPSNLWLRRKFLT